MLLSSLKMLAATLLLTTAPVAYAVNFARNASQPVITMPAFYGDQQFRLEGSIVAIKTQTTTVRVYCARGPHYGDCGLFPYETITYGPNTYNNYMSDEGFTGTQDCKTFGTTRAVCAEWATGSEANFPGSSTTTYSGSDIATWHVTVTGGAEKLASATSSGDSPTSSPSGTTSADAPTNTGKANALAIVGPVSFLGVLFALCQSLVY